VRAFLIYKVCFLPTNLYLCAEMISALCRRRAQQNIPRKRNSQDTIKWVVSEILARNGDNESYLAVSRRGLFDLPVYFASKA
jgi:hypothetical protein